MKNGLIMCGLIAAMSLTAKALFAQDGDVIKAAIVARTNGLTNLIIKCNVKEVDIPPAGYVEPTTQESRGHGLLITGASEYAETLFILDDLCRYEKEDIKSDKSFLAEPKAVKIFTPENYEQLDYLRDDRLAGTIYDVPPTFTFSSIARCLGVRMADRDKKRSPTDLNGAEITSGDNDQINVKMAVSKSIYFVAVFDKKLGYALVSQKAYNANKPDPTDVIENSDFKSVNGNWIPYHSEMVTGFYAGNQYIKTRTTLLEVEDCRVNDPANTKDLYSIVRYAGTLVVHNQPDVRK